MNKGHIWDIICFTIASNLKKKSFYITTIIIAVICMLAIPVIAYVSLSPDKKENSIKKIYICDSLGYNVDYKGLKTLDDDYSKVDIDIVNLIKKSKKQINTKIDKLIKKDVGEYGVIAQVELNEEKNEISAKIIIPKNSKIKKSNGEKLGEYLTQLLTLGKYEQATRTDNELLEVMTGVNVSVNILGKGQENQAFLLIKMYLPIVFSLIMYFMIMTYGQSLCNGMVTEKNSRIIELLVAHIKPGNLIVGKVLGTVTIALGQIIIWIVSLISGIYISNIIANDINNKDFIPIDTIIDAMKKGNVESAFSVGATVIFVVLLLMGFLFYCIYAAICSSFINKPDEVSSVFAVYTYTNVIAFMVVYMGSFMENKVLVNVARYIPFSAPYSSAVDVLVGNVTLKEGWIIVLIMLLCVVAILYILAKVYEKLVFNKLSLKELINNR